MKKTYRIANRFRFTVFVVLTIIVITTAFNFTLGFNTADSLTIQNYADIEVSYGDTLWSIAGNYITDEYSSMDAYINEVKYINSMGDTVITAGSSIIIPYYTGDYHE